VRVLLKNQYGGISQQQWGQQFIFFGDKGFETLILKSQIKFRTPYLRVKNSNFDRYFLVFFTIFLAKKQSNIPQSSKTN
jgi:hypothetical protein